MRVLSIWCSQMFAHASVIPLIAPGLSFLLRRKLKSRGISHLENLRYLTHRSRYIDDLSTQTKLVFAHLPCAPSSSYCVKLKRASDSCL